MTVNLIADLVKTTDGGLTIQKVQPISMRGELGARFTEVIEAVQSQLGTPEIQNMLPAANESPRDVKNKYKELAVEAFDAAVEDQTSFLGTPFAGVELELGPYIDSVWIPAMDTWEMFPGAAYSFSRPHRHGPTAPHPLDSLPNETKYYLNIRPQVVDLAAFCNYQIEVSSPGPLAGLAIFLSPSRTDVRTVRLSSSGARAGSLPHGVGVFTHRANGLFIYEGPVTATMGLVSVDIEFQGDPPHVRRATALLKGGPAVPEPPAVLSPSDELADPPAEAGLGSRVALNAYAHTIDRFFDYREAKIAAATEHKQAMEFFLALDRATQPGLASTGAQDFGVLGASLANRYLRRAESEHFDEKLSSGSHEQVAKRVLVQEAGGLIRSLMQTHLGDDGTGSLKSIRDAFERFGGGELTIIDTLGAPNGPNIFSFMELALLHIESGIDPEVWLRLLPIFGASVEIFVGSYHACGAHRTYCSYRVENNPKGERAPSDTEKEDIRALWSVAKPQDRYARLVHAALLDDMPTDLGIGSNKEVLPLQDFGCPRSPIGIGY